MHITNFLRYLEFVKRYSPNTIGAYKKDLEQFYEFVVSYTANNRIEQADTKTIRTWIIHLHNQELSKSTINRKLSAINTLYKYLVKEEIIPISPTKQLKRLKPPKRLPEFFTQNQMTQILDTATQEQTNFKTLTTYIVLEILYQTGIRVSELVDLQIKNTDLSQNQLKVTGKGNKTRIIPISESLSRQIAHYITHRTPVAQSPYLIVTARGNKSYDRMIQRIVKSASETHKTIKQRSPHTIRHSTATHLLNAGADINAVKELLGHQSLAATQIYTHNTTEHLQKIYKQAHPKSENK